MLLRGMLARLEHVLLPLGIEEHRVPSYKSALGLADVGTCMRLSWCSLLCLQSSEALGEAIAKALGA